MYLNIQQAPRIVVTVNFVIFIVVRRFKLILLTAMYKIARPMCSHGKQGFRKFVSDVISGSDSCHYIVFLCNTQVHEVSLEADIRSRNIAC